MNEVTLSSDRMQKLLDSLNASEQADEQPWTQRVKYRGKPFHKLQKSLDKKNLSVPAPNTRRGWHEIIDVQDLAPLESQRSVSSNWIEKALKLSQGFDFIAAGLIFVARDPETKKNLVWDGNGRLHMARAAGVPKLDCWVVDMTEKEAAHYFVHVQKTSNRTLDASTIFCNFYACGDEDALEEEQLLRRLGLRVQGSNMNDYWVPQVNLSERHLYPDVKISAVRQALAIAQGDEDLVRFARDTIVEAWPHSDVVRQDLLTGLVMFYMCYPEATEDFNSGKLKVTATAVRNYFNWLAIGTKQGNVPFKHTGGNMHNAEAESVARGIALEFRKSPFCTPTVTLSIPANRIETFIADKKKK